MFNLMPFGRGNNFLTVFSEITKNIIGSLNGFMPSLGTNITDLGDSYRMEIDVTGFDKDEVDIVVTDSTMTIKAHHDARVDYNKGNVYQYQRQFGSFTRSFDVSDIKVGEIKIDYTDNKLILELPKKNSKLIEDR